MPTYIRDAGAWKEVSGLQGTQGLQGLQGLQGTQGVQGIAGQNVAAITQVFTDNGTWTRPTGSYSLVYIEIWSGGGGGARATDSGGGGGGGAMSIILPYSLFSSTETVTVGAGGSGRTTAQGNGLGTAGETSSMTVGSATTLSVDGGNRGNDFYTTANGGVPYITESIINEDGGAGGNENGAGSYVEAQSRTYSGGGGGGRNSSTIRAGGTSIFGGDGGAGGGAGAGGNGEIPGGGGGASQSADAGNGARGEVRIYVW